MPDFAFCPKGRPPRLERFVEPGTLPGVNLLALYDAKQNLVIINRELFDKLSREDQRKTLRTQQPALACHIDQRGRVELRNYVDSPSLQPELPTTTKEHTHEA
jgi:hypothetical protein